MNEDKSSSPPVAEIARKFSPSSSIRKSNEQGSHNNVVKGDIRPSRGRRSVESAFTPVRASTHTKTPNTDINTNVKREHSILLSPASTITQTLTSLASSTAQQLEEVWDEVGYNSEERASQLSDLIMSFRDLCETKIAEERGVAETFRHTIAETRAEIRSTGESLETTVDPLLFADNTGQMTLTDELAMVEASLEGLRNAAVAAKEDLKECQDFLVEAYKSLGLEMEEKWKDIESDLSDLRRKLFHQKVEEMKEEVDTRTSAIIQLIRDCQHLMKELQIDVETSESTLDRRIVGSLTRSNDDNWVINDETWVMVSKFRSDSCTGIDSTALGELTERVAELNGEKRRRTVKLQEMGADIMVLWEKLKVSEEEQRAFTVSINGLGLDTIEKGEAELARLQILKTEMLGKLVTESRATIHQLWNEINASEDFRRDFGQFYVDDEDQFDEELLEKHDEYVATLTEKLENMKPVLKLIERRELIVRERVTYQELQRNPDRLKGRGAELTRQLMEEEKMSRRIKKELPKVTSALVDKLYQWKTAHGEDFLFAGEKYIDVMEKQEEEWNVYKERELQNKLKKKKKLEKDNVENSTYNGGSVGNRQYSHKPVKKARQDSESRHARALKRKN